MPIPKSRNTAVQSVEDSASFRTKKKNNNSVIQMIRLKCCGLSDFIMVIKFIVYVVLILFYYLRYIPLGNNLEETENNNFLKVLYVNNGHVNNYHF